MNGSFPSSLASLSYIITGSILPQVYSDIIWVECAYSNINCFQVEIL